MKLNSVLRVMKNEGPRGFWVRIKEKVILKSAIYQINLNELQEGSDEGNEKEFKLTPMTKALFQQMIEAYGTEISLKKKNMLRQRLNEDSTDRAYLLVEKDGSILGFYCISYGDNIDEETEYIVKAHKDNALLFDAYTFESHRKRGAQKYATVELLKMLKQKEFMTATVLIDCRNLYSRKAVLKSGFVKSGEVTHVNLGIWKGNFERKYGKNDR